MEKGVSEPDLDDRAARALFGALPGVIHLIDARGGLIWANSGAEGAPGPAPLEQMHPDDRDQARAVWTRLLEAPGEPIEWEYRARGAGGAWRWVSSIARNELARAGVGAIVVATRDVTEARSALADLQRRERQLRDAQRVAQIGSWEHDLATRSISWSEEVLRIFGFERIEDLSYESYRACIHPEDRAGLDERVGRCVEQGEPYEITLRIRRRSDGVERVIEALGAALLGPDQRAIRLYGTCRDVTEVAHARAEREKIERSRARSYRALHEFARIASHDLQEPVRKARLFAGRIKRRLSKRSDAKTLDDLARMERSTAHMSCLIAGLSEYAEIGATRPELLRPIRLKQALEEGISRADEALREVDLFLDDDQEWPEVRGDVHLLGRMFAHLLENAALYKRDGERASVEVRLGAPRVSGEVAVVVADRGVGFRAIDAASIFAPCRRLPHPGAPERAGIGLTVCRAIAHLHDGEIEAAPRDGGGAELTVRLRRA